MREAIGGTWLLGFVVLFIALFSGFLAFSINYTKAFKVKNKIINIIEENEGFTTYSGDFNTFDYNSLSSDKKKLTEVKVYQYLTSTGYAMKGDDIDLTLSKRCENDGELTYYKGGYCVKKISTQRGSYYKVRTFIKLEIPVVWITVTIPINGETQTLYYTND